MSSTFDPSRMRSAENTKEMVVEIKRMIGHDPLVRAVYHSLRAQNVDTDGDGLPCGFYTMLAYHALQQVHVTKDNALEFARNSIRPMFILNEYPHCKQKIDCAFVEFPNQPVKPKKDADFD